MNCVASFVVVHRRNRWRHLAIAGDAVFVEGRVTSCKRVNYPAGYRGENSIKVIAHLFLLLLLNQPLTWSPNFFLVRIFPKSSPGQRPWLRPSNCFNFMQMRRRMNEFNILSIKFCFFRFGTLWNGEKWETTTLCSAKLSTGSNEREPFLTLPKRLARPATLRPLDRPIDTSPMCRRATSWLPFHAPKRWNYHQNQFNFKFQILFKSY